MQRPGRLAFPAMGILTMLLTAVAASAQPQPAPPDPIIAPCSLASTDEIRPLIARGDQEIRPKSDHPETGKATCTWSAYERGLSSDAPPTASIVMSVYRFADAAKAQAQTRKLAKDAPPPPKLAKTADSSDEVIRPSGDDIVARHGAIIATVDGSGAAYAASQQADFIYRLEALALKAAGATVEGPVDARATADPCHLVQPQKLLALLTLSPSTLKSSVDGNRCMFSVRDRSGTFEGSFNNRGGGDLRIKDLGSNAAALKFQHDQTPFYLPSLLVKTADPTDRVVLDPKSPQFVWAVHGPYYVELTLSTVMPEARANPTWTYRVQRAALEAAGATILPRPDLPPDPVLPQPVPERKDVAVDADWTPPRHDAPASAAVLDPLLHVLSFCAAYRFFLMPAALAIIPLVLILRALGRRMRPGRAQGIGLIWLIPAAIVLAVVNIMAGPWVATKLVYHFGEAGSATVTGSRATGTQYNNRNVVRYLVLIRTAEGKTVESDFRTDAFNVYPPHNLTAYPGPDAVFTVRYLSRYPQDFVIVSDDGSPWARSRRCGGRMAAVSEARGKASFAPKDDGYRKAYEDALKAARTDGCVQDVPQSE